MLTRRDALFIPALAALSACQRLLLATTMTGPAEAAWISAYIDNGWYGRLLGPVALINVAIQTVAEPRETVWEIARPRTGNELVHRVQYRILPAGFTEVVAPQRLSEGIGYELTLASTDYREGALFFVIENGRVQSDNA